MHRSLARSTVLLCFVSFGSAAVAGTETPKAHRDAPDQPRDHHTEMTGRSRATTARSSQADRTAEHRPGRSDSESTTSWQQRVPRGWSSTGATTGERSSAEASGRPAEPGFSGPTSVTKKRPEFRQVTFLARSADTPAEADAFSIPASPDDSAGQPQPTDTPSTSLSATEQLKQMLAERYRGENTESNRESRTPAGNVADADSRSPVSTPPGRQLPVSPVDMTGTELSADSLSAARAARFEKLKSQLMLLRSQVHDRTVGENRSELPPGNASTDHSGNSSNVKPGEQNAEAEPSSARPSKILFYPPGSERPEEQNAQSDSDSAAASSTTSVTAPDSDPRFSTKPPMTSSADTNDESSEAPADRSERSTTEPEVSETSQGSGITSSARVGGQNIVSGPIDRIGLANNLYAVGEYQLALEMYQQTEKSSVPPQQQHWLEYQQANCLRRLGQRGEASNRYRRLSQQPGAGWLGEISGWWVTQLEHVRQLEKALESDPDEDSLLKGHQTSGSAGRNVSPSEISPFKRPISEEP